MQSMERKLLLLWALIGGQMLLLLMGSSQAMGRQHDGIDIKDKIIELQCLARCENGIAAIDAPQLCHEQCKLELLRAPRRGKCPSMLATQPARLLCLDNCVYDHDCVEVQKCCPSACGNVCVDALSVRNDTMLPPIPKIVRYSLPRRHRVQLVIESSRLAYFFHVEVRSHIGRFFTPRKLGMWQWQPVEKLSEETDGRSKFTAIFFNIRPGRWYQVRVAAVNAYGFRGYSQPSQQFTLTTNPKPPKAPQDLRVVSKHYDGRTMGIKLIWCPSKSNLPVEKYKIIWSLYVSSRDGSLISHEAYVKDAHHFEINRLQPDSSYYIQVQAMAISGSQRLKSDKKSMLFNTTLQPLESFAPLKCATHNYKRRPNLFASPPSSSSSTEQILTNEITRNANANNRTVLALAVAAPVVPTSPSSSSSSYEVRFRLNRKFGMIVQILGFQPHKEKVYELCPQESNCEQREFSAIRVKKDSLEFSKLKYNTTYVLKALRPNSVLHDSNNAFTFTTPKCENFRKRFPKMQIRCGE